MELWWTFLTKRIIRALLILLVLNSGCRNTSSRAIGNNTSEAVQFQEPDRILFIPSDSTDHIYKGLKNRDDVNKFYEITGYKPAWTNAKSLSTHGDSMVSLIREARYYGLLPINYHIREVEAIKRSIWPHENLLRIDVLLTDAFLSFSHDIKYGRSASLALLKEDSVSIFMLYGIVNGAGLKMNLESREPVFSGYHLLKNALRTALDTLRVEDRKAIMKGGLEKRVAHL